MLSDMLLLPLRLAARVTRFGLHLTEQAALDALSAARRLTGTPTSRAPRAAAAAESSTLRVDVVLAPSPARVAKTPAPEPQPQADAAPPPAVRTPAPAAATPSTDESPEARPAAPETRPAVAARAVAEPTTPDPAAAPAPAHVSEELRLVETLAEPGAEEGAGAAVHVRAPWKGYSRMTASEVIGRLSDASPEGLTAVTLYETAHRNRQTVLAAARRNMRRATATTAAARR